jgi:hypothetical protein
VAIIVVERGIKEQRREERMFRGSDVPCPLRRGGLR